MQQLKQLGLTQLEQVLPALFETARQQQWTYETFLGRAIAAEIEGRDRRAAERRMTAARLPTLKTLEAFDFAFQPTLSERLLWELADLSFVQTATNVLFLGPPGTGKTHLSLALTVKVLAAGYSALFTTLSHLAEALASAPYPSLMRQRLRRYTTPRSGLHQTIASPGSPFLCVGDGSLRAWLDPADLQHQLCRLGHLAGRRDSCHRTA